MATPRKSRPKKRGRKPGAKYRSWLVSEEKYLAWNWGTIPTPEIAAKLGRTIRAINMRANLLGMASRSGMLHKRKYCRMKVKQLIDQGLSSGEIGKRLGCEPSLIRRMARREFSTDYGLKLAANGRRAQAEAIVRGNKSRRKEISK